MHSSGHALLGLTARDVSVVTQVQRHNLPNRLLALRKVLRSFRLSGNPISTAVVDLRLELLWSLPHLVYCEYRLAKLAPSRSEPCHQPPPPTTCPRCHAQLMEPRSRQSKKWRRKTCTLQTRRSYWRFVGVISRRKDAVFPETAERVFD